MNTRVPCSLVFSALLLTFAVEHFAFLPPARGQAAQAAAAVSARTRAGAQTQRLRGQVPAALAHLQPIGRLNTSNRLNLAIGLPLRDPDALTRFLAQLHDPANPIYRHYLTPEEFAARFGPTEQDYQAVIAFAQAHGLAVRSTHHNRTLLDVSGSVADIEKALHLTLRVYQHPTERRTFYAPEAEPVLDLAVPVLGISGLDNYSLPRPRLQAKPLDQLPNATPNSGAGPQGTYMGGDFRAAYVPNSALTGAGQSVGLLQFDGYTASDITYYESKAGLPNVPLSNVLLDGFNGSPTGGGGEVEVSLDIETAISMAPGLAGVIVYMAGPYGNFHDVLNRMATDNLAKQLSCSWYMPGAGADAVADQIFQQMAAQGQSFFNASGDYDAFTGPVDFPGETPYIVQVGGTTLTTSGPGGVWVSEKVWNWNNGIGTGGGISTRYAIPSYQANISMALNQGSTTMRNIPDVALTADNVYVRADGRDYNVGGTSCAAPLWAGFAALVNQQAVASGRPVVGFINPAVDTIGTGPSFTSCFHDITTGDNTRSGSPAKFYAVAGYDLCTGWGTPAGQTLINALATPDALLLSPLALAFSGVAGGPFSPNPGSLTLTNSGTNALSWTLVNTSAWFNVSPTSGTLLPGGVAATVSVSIDPSANTLSPGVYTAVLALTNQTSGVAQSCSLALSVAALGMADDFDPGLDLSQWSSFGGVVGSTVLATNYGGSVSASNSLWFGSAGSRFATTIPINTSSGGQIGFCLRLANGPAWPWAQPDNLPAEGVVLECSTNGGGSWTAIGNYDTPVYYNWTGVAFPIPAVAQAPATLFRWRQLSNSGTNYDHWALDNVVINTDSIAPQIVMDPQGQTVAAGDPASLSVAAVGTPPLSYQWLLNGTNVNGATASSLAWADVQLSDAGTYSVLVSNNLGSALSSDARLSVYVVPCAPPPPGLVSWWRAEGDATDCAGTNNGILQGGATFAPGRVGQAFGFNGTNSYIEVPSSPALKPTGPFTVEGWVNYDGFTGPNGGGIVTKGQDAEAAMDWTLDIGAAHELRPGVMASGHWVTYGCASALATGVWYHVAMVYDGSSVRVYLNGLLDGSAGASGAVQASDYALRIGAYAPVNGTANKAFLLGRIDELSLYGRALSIGEIQTIYNARGTGKCADPIAPYIVSQPANQTVTAGTDVTFSIAAGGSPPLSYQWWFGATNLPGATATSLTLTNVQAIQAGSYFAVVTNALGSVTSSNALLTVVPPPPCAPPPQGLVSWWRAEGDASDWAGANNGTMQGGVTFAPGRVGQAFGFNGTNSYIEVPSSPALKPTGPFTVEGWVNYDGFTGPNGGGIITKGQDAEAAMDWALGVGPARELRPGVMASGYWVTYGCASTLAPGVWYHVAMVYDGSSVRVYLNGLLDGSAGASGAVQASDYALRIGAYAPVNGTANKSYLLGRIDELSLYGRALSAAEIQAVYNAGSAGKCADPIAPYILLQPTNQVATVGENVMFSTAAGGTPPLSYQWLYWGTNLPGATAASLTLTNVQATQAGSYFAVVTNALGSVTSSNALLTVNAGPPCAPPPQGLVSWWRAEGDATDYAGVNNGTLQGAVTFAPGRVGQAFNLNGTNSYIQVPSSPALKPTGPFTVEGWVNYNGFTGPNGGGIITKGQDAEAAMDWTLVVGPARELRPGVMAGGYWVTYGCSSALATGVWYHVAMVYDGSSVRVYLNGLLDGSAGASGAVQASDYALRIGAYAPVNGTANKSYLLGRIDELSLYGRALSAAEIQAVYNAGSAGKCGLAPSIQTPPQSQTIQYSSNAMFSVTAAGLSPLAYRWYFGSNPIAGASNALLTVTNAGFAQAGSYSVVVTNAFGSATGGPAVLTVVDTIPPTIIACASNRTLSAGANCTASLPDLTGDVVAQDASGPVTVIQSPPPGTQLGLGITNVAFTAQDSSGNTSVCVSSLTIADTTPPFVMACVLELTVEFDTNCQALLPDLTGTNYIVARDNCSSVSVTQAPPALTAMPAGTNTVLLTVSDNASNQTTRTVAVIVPGGPHIAVPPAGLTLAASSNATFSVLACGAAPLSYQWQHSSTNLPSATNVVLTLSNITTNHAGDYRVVLTNPDGSITSAVATLTVLQPPVITRQPRNAVAAPGATASFSVAAKGLAPMSYQWQQNGAPLAGQTKASLTVSNVQPADFTGYVVGITNADGGVLSAVAMLTLAASPVINSPGFNSSTFMLTVPTEVGPTYVVEYKDDLLEPSWTVLTTLAGTGLPASLSDNGLTNATRFYRVRVR
jgi:Concanavalin A-like lectin/glucanases superfamily/Pro-kumamolisin, activation domain/Reelin subrepeat B/Immunoglobulin domain/HYR domain/Viral BACON domain